MRGSLDISSKRSPKAQRKSQKSEVRGFEQDPEIVKLHDQIDAVEESSGNFNAEIKHKTSFYEAEIQNLQTQLKKKQIEAETSLSSLREKNANELNEIDQQNEMEVQGIKEQINNFGSRRNAFKNQHSEALRVRKEAELAELKRQLEQLRIRHTEHSFDATTQNQTSKMTTQAKIAELRAQIELLDGEIKEVTAKRQEDLQSTSLKVQQTSSAFETRCKEQSEKLEQYRAEVSRRQAQCEEMTDLAEQQAQAETQQMENNLNVAVDRVGKMQQTLDRYTRRLIKEQQVIHNDISAMKESISRAQKMEEEQLIATKDQITKLQAASSDTIALDQEIESLRNEIMQTKNDNADMRRERTRLDTSMYSTRLSRFHSSK